MTSTEANGTPMSGGGFLSNLLSKAKRGVSNLASAAVAHVRANPKITQSVLSGLMDMAAPHIASAIGGGGFDDGSGGQDDQQEGGNMMAGGFRKRLRR
jgi:hypothetical protein